MGEVAVRVAQAAGYSNAGTVEFLVDQQKNFFFLEMNTRLQVEHPVTELTTGLDLVHLQIRIAAGERLPFTQNEVKIRGHAIECRIYAEDPDNNYFPSPGKITLLLAPSGPGIRRDSGMYEGWTVPMDYDPLLAKLIGYGTDRDQAIGRLRRALNEYFVGGIKTNISLFRRILTDPDFRAAKMDTGFLDRLLKQKGSAALSDPKATEVAVIAAGIFATLGPAAAGTGERAVTGDAREQQSERGLQLENCSSSRGDAMREWPPRLEAVAPSGLSRGATGELQPATASHDLRHHSSMARATGSTSVEPKAVGRAGSMDAKSKSTLCSRGPMCFLSASATRLTK